MKEHPILFSGPMVRAILEGRKTMTRRVINPQGNIQPGCWDACRFQYSDTGYSGPGWYCWDEGCEDDGSHFVRCPHGQRGDRLWVRETFAHDQCNQEIWYKAGQVGTGNTWITGSPPKGEKMRPSIHMPRWASRILLEIVSVRVERVQDISEHDARQEGAEAKNVFDLKNAPASLTGWRPGLIISSSPRFRHGFYELWESINARRGFGWDANPWVWVIEFERIDA